MKKMLCSLMTVIITVSLMANNVYAMSHNPDDYTSVEMYSELLPPSAHVSTAHESAQLRGDFFLNADLIIIDNSNGDIGAFAKAYMSIPVDEIYITLYLDRWEADADRWRQVAYYDAEFYAKDYPDGLTDPTLNITFKNQQKGYYYRLRGVFGAIHDGKFEGFSPVTDGILIK